MWEATGYNGDGEKEDGKGKGRAKEGMPKRREGSGDLLGYYDNGKPFFNPL